MPPTEMLAYERLEGGADSRALLTCEHASNALPAPWSWPEADQWLVDTHWAWDPGAAAVTRAVSRHSQLPTVLSTFSRLLADPNRPEDHPDLFRTHAEGRSVVFNRSLTPDDVEARLAFHRGYHEAVDQLVRDTPNATVWSIHSFTPVYEGGAPRSMEVGVIFNHEEALADRVATQLEADGWAVARNEPYSGKEGLMYAADRHAHAHGRQAIELELRQDLLVPGPRRDALVRSIASVIQAQTA